MTFSQKITLSLFLAGANAATIQPPFAAGTTNDLKFATDLYEIDAVATGQSAGDYTTAQTEKSAVVEIEQASDSTKHNIGLYGCLMSELLAFPTQGFAMTSTGTDVADTDAQATDARMFWGNIAAHQGTQAKSDNMDSSSEIDGNSFFECCTADALVISDADTYGQCPSAFALDVDTNVNDFAATTVPAAGRVNFAKNGFDYVLEDTASGAVADQTLEWQPDFLLASQAQLNAVDSSTVGFCSGEWRTVMTSDSAMDLEALTDFNSNTKCTWQITAKSGSAPQFQLKESPTSQILLHFIEWADNEDLASTTLATKDLLPAVDTAGTIEIKIGAYDRTTGTYFNPFVSDSIDDGTVGYEFGTTANSAFTEVTRSSGPDGNSYYPGAPIGNWDVYVAGASPFDIDDTIVLNDDASFMWGVQAALNSAAAVYSNWESELDSYNSDAADYNDDIKAYNDALAADDGEELPEIPDRPCPPGDIEEIDAVQPYYNDATAFDAEDYEDREFAAQYKAQDSAANDEVESWAFGFLRSAADVNSSSDYSDEYDTSMYAGKIFGRFGQGANNMPNAAAPLRFADPDDNSDFVQSMMISIFPSVGTSWNGGDAITTDTITVEVSGAALSWTDILIVPSASGSADDLDDADFAKVLGASAMVMAASIAALY